MTLYMIEYDGERDWVEAGNLPDAVRAWRENTAIETEEPSSILLVHDAPVLRSIRPPGLLLTETLVNTLRRGCHANYNGGHSDPTGHTAFHHGMDTAFNVLAAMVRSAETGESDPQMNTVLWCGKEGRKNENLPL